MINEMFDGAVRTTNAHFSVTYSFEERLGCEPSPQSGCVHALFGAYAASSPLFEVDYNAIWLYVSRLLRDCVAIIVVIGRRDDDETFPQIICF
jgi:hypothetical protein